jgi:phosphotransferase system HPr-like phosphotransfer protein
VIEETSEGTLLFTGEDGTRGLHTRSAALLVRWTAGLDARLKIRIRGGEGVAFRCDPPAPGAFVWLCGMGVRPGETLEISAEGPDAERALYGARRALQEEPPPSPRRSPEEYERLLRWDARARDGMRRDAALETLEGELQLWLRARTRRRRTPKEQRDFQRRGDRLVKEATLHNGLTPTNDGGG